MGFNVNQLGQNDQEVFRTLEPRIIEKLRHTASHAALPTTECRAAKVRWFGSLSPQASVEDAWMRGTLKTNLNAMASVLNTNTFTVTYTKFNQRDLAYYGWALTPMGGWQAYTNMTAARNQNFTIQLDSQWRIGGVSIMYPNRTTFRCSKFHAIVHELTHLILGTDDVAPPYGPVNCQNKASTSPGNARNNADNWAFFVDQIYHADPVTQAATATGALPSHKKWMDDTKLGVFYPRSKQLKNVDEALKQIERGLSPQRKTTLRGNFNTWYNANPNDRQRRNKNNIVEDLRTYIRTHC